MLLYVYVSPQDTETAVLSRLTVVSRAAKQSRTRDTTVCYYT